MSLLKKIIAEVGEVDEVGELVALLCNSQLPTVVVEAASDVRIYKPWVEWRLFGTYKVDVLAAGGRDNLLSLYERRNEFADVPIVFVANRGMWMFSEISEHYADIILTQGYSVENDIYSKGGIENLAHPDTAKERWLVKESIIKWFAFEVEEFLAGRSQEVNLALDKLVPIGQAKLDRVFCKNRNFRYPESETIEEIRNQYRFKLPGKLLFEMLARFSNTSLDSLYNIALANYKAKPQELIEKIRRNLDEQRSVSSQEILPEPKKRNQVPSKQQAKVLDTNRFNSRLTSKSEFIINKLVSDLKSANLPNVLVGGKDNTDIINKLVEDLEINDMKMSDMINVRVITRRDILLSVFDRRDEFVHILPVAFVADQEMWRFSGIPERYADIIWTQGYSLENDLYAEANLESLLAPHETWKHRQVLNSTIKWFAFEVEEFLAGRIPKMDVELSDLVLPGQLALNKGFCQQRDFYQPRNERVQEIKKAYKHLLPGKFLFQILTRFLNTRGRNFNFNISDCSLHDIALMEKSNFQLLNTLMEMIEDKLISQRHNQSIQKQSPLLLKSERQQNRIILQIYEKHSCSNLSNQ